MMPPLRSFDDVDGRERVQKKTDDLRAMTTLGPRTLYADLDKTLCHPGEVWTLFSTNDVIKSK